MKLGKVTIKNGKTWITVKGDLVGRFRVVQLDVEATSVEEKGTTIVVKTK